MPNTKFKVEGHVYSHNTPTRKVIGGKEYFLTLEGTKAECEASARDVRKRDNLARVVKTAKGYERPSNILHPKRKHPYALYVRSKNWK